MVRAPASLLTLCLCALPLAGQTQDWVVPMQQVHSRYTGLSGRVAQFGDSITITQAFFSPLRNPHTNASPQAQSALTWIQGYVRSECWGWKGWSYGNNGGTISDFALNHDFSPSQTNIEYWLATLNPELAVIMWGTNDAAFELEGPGLPNFTANMTTIVQRCKANGTIPILTTIPPMHFNPAQWGGAYVNVTEWVNAIRNVAAAEHVPLIDYYGEIIARRPNNPGDPTDGQWNGTLLNYNDRHPSNTAPTQDFSASSLSNNGYTLRNYVTLLKMYEVYNQSIVPEPAGLALLALGGLALLRKRAVRQRASAAARVACRPGRCP